MTDVDRAINVLNALLDREQRALAPRLLESTVFVSSLSLGDYEWVRRATRVNLGSRAVLTEQIVELGGEPAPRRGDLMSADLHFQELRTIEPRIERELVELVRVYRAALSHLGGFPRVSASVSVILAEHESDLAAFRSRQAGNQAKAAS